MSLTALALTLALSQTTAPTTFPDAYLGQWAEDLADCGGEDTQGVKIEPDRVEFYEAQGPVKSIEIEPNGAVASEVQFSGEGRSWTEPTYFRLSNDMASVEVRALGQKLILMRCPVVLDL